MPSAPAPIRIGYCLSLTGPLAGNSQSARLAHDIWQEDVNSRGGLLGCPVEFVCYDDQADASHVPGLYQRLIDDDKVNLVIGGYGTNTILPAMPLIMEGQRFFVGLMGLGVNNTLAYPNYFAMIPTGPDPNAALTEGFFALAAEQTPQAATVALLSADAEFSRNPILGAKTNADKYGFSIVPLIRWRPPTSHRSLTLSPRAAAIYCFSAAIFRTRSTSCAPSMRTRSAPSWLAPA
jgi:branched-chain amino acid transport system substrate-binding protein